MKKIAASMIAIIVLPLLLANLQAASASEKIESFMKSCESKISKNWQDHALDQYRIPEHFREHAKGVVNFDLDRHGNLKHVKVRHSARESLIYAAWLKYGPRANALMKALDDSMISAVKESSPFPELPTQLYARRSYAVVFDNQRLKPLRMYIDNQ